ncbi:hypothetical protein [uncultured Jatrophihabitans sp.]|uniref:hypothetical protein n=1 Tax=uncultured Jatrophihabitans sp. TaxID=1610747 RepID=UPI0035CA1D41
MKTDTLSRSMHDVGLAAWFGGTLANAVALNAAAGAAGSPRDAGAVANAGWNRWTPVNAAAIGVHLAGSVGQLAGNRDRLRAQHGVGQMALVKTGMTIAALGATAYARAQGAKIAAAGNPPMHDGTREQPQAPGDVAGAARQLTALQWLIPALTGGLIVVSSFAGEQQRPAAVLSGLRRRATR